MAEVAIVAAIVGVLASLGIASLVGVTGRARQQRDADGVEDLVRKARNLARNERRCVRIDATASRLTSTPLTHASRDGAGRAILPTPPPDCSAQAPISVGDDAARRAVLDLAPGVRLGPTSFLLDSSGGAVNGPQDILVTVTASGAAPRTFTVRTLVGAGAVVRRGL